MKDLDFEGPSDALRPQYPPQCILATDIGSQIKEVIYEHEPTATDKRHKIQIGDCFFLCVKNHYHLLNEQYADLNLRHQIVNYEVNISVLCTYANYAYFTFRVIFAVYTTISTVID